MFAKLLKHEFKASGRLLGILSLCAVGSSIIGSILLFFLINIIESNADGIGAILGALTAGLLWFAIFLALIAYSITVSIVLLYRFYKHLFSDEGYLTFTLPISTHQLLLSKILHISICAIGAVVVVFVSGFILVSPLIAMLNKESATDIFSVFGIFADQLGQNFVSSQVFYAIAAAIYSLILPLSSITIGSLWAKKHKILCSIGIYFGLTVAMSIISTIISIIMLFSSSQSAMMNMDAYTTLTAIIPGILYLGLGISGYFLMHHLLKHKLNLT